MVNYEQMELIESMESSAESPVSPTLSQGIGKAGKILAHFTPTSSDCFAKLDQNLQWLKMSRGYSQLTLDGSPEIYSETLPKNGMLLGGKLYPVPSLGELMRESGYLSQQSEKTLLPTPKHMDKATAGVKAHKKGQQKHLSVAVRKLLPTPVLTNNKTKLLLNPEFTERMMGFPQGWTDEKCDRLEEPELLQLDRLNDYLPLALCEEKLKHRIRLGQIGNAIVPQVGSIMFDLVAEVLDRDEISDCLRQPSDRPSKPISFTHTSDRLLIGQKTVTRRKWKDVTAKIFTRYYQQGRLIDAYDKSPRNGGKCIAQIKLTQPPYKEKLADMPVSDLAAEGGMCQTVEEFIDTYFGGDRSSEIWVIRFEVISKLPRCNENKDFQQSVIPETTQKVLSSVIDEQIVDKLFPKKSKSDKQKNDRNCGRFEKLDKTVGRYAGNEAQFYELAIALLEIKTDKLYKKVGYRGFRKYCSDRHNLKKTYVDDLIRAIPIYENIPEDIDKSDITESHCRELRKIKDPQERSRCIKAVANTGTITAKAIANAHREMKIKKINNKHKPNLPKVGSVVRITSKHDQLATPIRHPKDVGTLQRSSKKYNGYWGIVREKYEFTIDIAVLGGNLSAVNPQDFIYLNDADAEFCQKLLERLNNIYTQPKINDTAKGVLIAIASRPYPLLEEMDECLLSCLEERINDR